MSDAIINGVATMPTQSNTIGEIAKALSKAQGEMKPAEKDGKSHFGPYATLESCIQSSNKILEKHGLAISQSTLPVGSQLYVVSTLMHGSGEWLRGYFPILSKDSTPQAVGSGTSYARRFAYSAIISQAIGDDDDADTAQGLKKQSAAPMRPKTGNTPAYDERREAAMSGAASPKQLNEMTRLGDKLGMGAGDRMDFLGERGIDSKAITKQQASDCIADMLALLNPISSDAKSFEASEARS